MKNFVSSDDGLEVVAPYDVLSGDPFLVNGLFGVAQDNALEDESVVMNRRGIFDLKKEVGVGTAINALNEVAYFNPTTKVVTADDATEGNVKIGAFRGIAGDDDTQVRVLLVPNLEAAVPAPAPSPGP
jgi:predicted RecA/RadA family phage recombinase